jgi:hypothetical protein
MMPKWSVPCWNCDEGFIEPIDEWDDERCDHCKGKGFLIVTQLTDDNYDEAVPVDDDSDALRNILADALKASADKSPR